VTEPKTAWLEEIGQLKDRQNAGDRTWDTENALIAAVRSSRQCGATWQEIGDAMGTTRQYANKRFGPIP
jgi:hypothetical protein